MSAQQTIESIFSKVFNYTWHFTEGESLASLSCIAFSVEEARKNLLTSLKQIDDLAEEKKLVKEKIKELYKKYNYDVDRAPKLSLEEYKKMLEESQQLQTELWNKLPQIDNNTGAYCTRLIDYGLAMKIEDEDVTLGEFISTTEPTVKKILPIRAYSCLDG